MGDLTAILIAVALLAGNAFFVGAEFALIAARRTQIEPRAAEGSRRARLTLRAMERVSLMMAGAQLGITMCSLGLGAIGEPAVAHLLEVPLAAVGIEGALLHGIAFAIALAVVVFLHMVLGEMVPKNIAIAGPERSALVLGPVLYGVVLVLKPVIVALNWVANVVLRALRVEPRDEVASAFTADEVAAFIAESREEGLIEEGEGELLASALTLSDQPVRAVTVPLDDLVTLPVGVTYAQAEEACVRTGFSRFPIADDAAHLVGYVHLKDLLMVPDGMQDTAVPPGRVRALAHISAETPLDTALTALQARGAHLAVVRDGQTVLGVAMFEDVVERLVGEVADAAQSETPRDARRTR
ncbi:hemolysin family protein [Actinotalea sp. Marseille-Q4924]|uniref:hemolysin family protein n=1 Tax=Actinotalea sp. Marseille-Q4924 TaxID=2866571 RepID=UPI001CE4ACC8|nr:hemolysin family protein [Actinotalea sp. Marseille-Q4924]